MPRGLGPASGVGPGISALHPGLCPVLSALHPGLCPVLSALHPGVQQQKKNIREIFNTNPKIMKLCIMNGYGMLNISAKFQIKTP
jgi:hypothetical protein